MKYTAKVIEKIDNKPGEWTSLQVGVFCDDVQIGTYQRNYHALMSTFFAFTRDGKDYALYSPDYTATRVMALPSCVDLGGEERDSSGFCPVEYFVPTYADHQYSTGSVRINNPNGPIDGEPQYCPFGFVSGCVWGDDSSWKVQYLDLARAAEGVIVRSEKFGYLELPNGINLSKAIDMDNYDDRYPYISIASAQHFNLITGERDA